MRSMLLRLVLAVGLALSFTGCIFLHPDTGYGRGRGQLKSDCPPGHRWDDGRCHKKGKGHDKHHGKKQGKKQGKKKGHHKD